MGFFGLIIIFYATLKKKKYFSTFDKNIIKFLDGIYSFSKIQILKFKRFLDDVLIQFSSHLKKHYLKCFQNILSQIFRSLCKKS